MRGLFLTLALLLAALALLAAPAMADVPEDASVTAAAEDDAADDEAALATGAEDGADEEAGDYADEEADDDEDEAADSGAEEGFGAEEAADDEEGLDAEDATADASALEVDAEDGAVRKTTSCRSLYRAGKRTNGYYTLSNRSFKGKAYCNMRGGGWQLCGAISAAPSGSSFKVARQTYNTPTSRSFSANCEKYMRKGARLRVTKSRTSPAATSHNQCTFRDNAVTGKARKCRESRTQVSWWQPGYLGCYSAGNKHRFGITRAGQPKTSLCMRNSHWIGSNQCHCHNAFGAWAGRKYTGMLYVWVMPAPPRRRVIAARRKAIRRKTRKPLRRTVRKKKRSTRGAARAAHRARIARMRAKHAAFKGKVTGAVQQYATRETQRLIKWFIGTYLDKDAVSLAKPLEKRPPVPKRRLDPEPGPSPSDPEPFEVKHRRKPDSPGVRDGVIVIPGLVQEKNNDPKLDVYPPKP